MLPFPKYGQPRHFSGLCRHFILIPFDILHICNVSSHLWTAHIGTRADCPTLAIALVPSMMLLPAGRGRAEEKQNRTSSDLSGESAISFSLPSGDNAPEEVFSLTLLLSPHFLPSHLLHSPWDMFSFQITSPLLQMFDSCYIVLYLLSQQ